MLVLNNKFGQSAQITVLKAASQLEKASYRRHEVLIITCYLQLTLIEKYIAKLEKIVRVTDVFLAFEYSEIFKLGASETYEKLNSIKQSLKRRRIDFEYAALKSSQLMHGKAYGVIQRHNSQISDGFVLISSANFTKAGFLGKNIELGVILSKKKDLIAFEDSYYDIWDELDEDIEEIAFEQKSVLFKYALLSKGVFLHKWGGNLKQQVGIRYELTEKAKKMNSTAPELSRLGFEAGNSFTRQVLDLSFLPKKEVPREFITRFTIETYWGRWCPKDAWTTLNTSSNGGEKFLHEFKMATNPDTINGILFEAKETQNQLIDQGLIERVREEHLENWRQRIESLRENTRWLQRNYSGYDANEIPYSIEQRQDISDLFENLRESIELKKNKNIAKKKVIAAIEQSQPNILSLSKGELNLIRGYTSNY